MLMCRATACRARAVHVRSGHHRIDQLVRIWLPQTPLVYQCILWLIAPLRGTVFSSVCLRYSWGLRHPVKAPFLTLPTAVSKKRSAKVVETCQHPNVVTQTAHPKYSWVL
jgi:hypothetical protein